ncbi:hypothetical protein TNCV_2227491 [Trichonephila clavipes]|uniref:Uncharacterized protein n=1 Tax=Trichonephila clavipes TaxID=2585209 RepID=A0A8X7BJF8_TRICX|nr:hypothetical protein TNCV_2227491 [Trichonephila clavipes]
MATRFEHNVSTIQRHIRQLTIRNPFSTACDIRSRLPSGSFAFSEGTPLGALLLDYQKILKFFDSFCHSRQFFRRVAHLGEQVVTCFKISAASLSPAACIGILIANASSCLLAEARGRTLSRFAVALHSPNDFEGRPGVDLDGESLSPTTTHHST